MNYFLILGVIVTIVLFLALLLNSVSKVVQQSEARDVIFTMIGVCLAFSILVVFIFAVNSLGKAYTANIKEKTYSIIVPGHVDMVIKTKNNNSFMAVPLEDTLATVIVGNDVKYKKNSQLAGQMKIDVIMYEAPYTWYMFNWYVDSVNNSKTYILKEVYE